MICGSCGRTLNGSKSIERGYGPICYRKIHPIVSPKKKKIYDNPLDSPDYTVPGQMELTEFIEMEEKKGDTDGSNNFNSDNHNIMSSDCDNGVCSDI